MTPVSQIMTKGELHTVKPEDALSDALKVISQKDLKQVPVVSNSRLVGILSRANVLNYLQLSAELGVKKGGSQPRPMQPAR